MTTTEDLAINNILNSVAERGATDIHFAVGSNPYFRINDRLITLSEAKVTTPAFMETLIKFFVPEKKQELLRQSKELKFVYNWLDKARFRVNVFQQKGYYAVSLKLILPQIKTVAELSLPKIVNSFTAVEKGLIIISGPYNSGRSTTLAGILETINRNRSERIVYLENPVEQLFVNQRSIIEQREIGTDVISFSEGLQSLKEEDVNVVAISRVDCLETLELVLELSVSGRLVLVIMDYDTSLSCLTGMISEFPEAKKEWVRNVLADYLVGLVVQRLVPGVGEMVLAAEILTASSSSKALIAEGRFNQLESIIQTSRIEGMMSLDYSLANLVKAGRISQDVALKYAQNPRTLSSMLAK
ncbi:Flp pilus assembly complex ATPase component TadA [Patescibacteria group bacterium]|nr:Flp pilus assembly complex ATPase component TadA [Patescibacteria group bacterium]